MSSKRVRSLWLFAILLCACGPSRRTWHPRDVPSEMAFSAFAVVRTSTPLSIAPQRGAPQIYAMARQRIFDPTSPPAFLAFRMIGTRGGWAELETIGEERELHCADTIDALEGLRVRFFVPAGALAPITTREVEQSFPDGTRIALSRGAPLEPLPGTPLVRVHLGSSRTVVRLSAADFGTRYLPSEIADTPASLGYVSRDALQAAVPILGQTGRVEGLEALEVYDQRAQRGEVLVEVRPRCARIVMRVPPHTILPPGGMIGTEVEDRSPPYVRAGARLTWRSGREAGSTARDALFDRESEPESDRRCFVRALADESADPSAIVELCVARADVIDPNVPPASLLEDPR